MELEFKRDTAFRKQFFTPESFSHPAKMDSHLLLWIVEKYTETGEVILDIMAGMGTAMLACTLGRNVILVELEEKFCKMCQDNWEIVKTKPQLGHQIGNCQIIEGDARQLEGLLVDKIITSPPYAEAHDTKNLGVGDGDRADLRAYSYLKESEGNISNLPYGQIDKIVTSPPYASGGHHADQTGAWGGQAQANTKEQANYGQSQGQIGQLPYSKVNSIITSPPYEGSFTHSEQDPEKRFQRLKEVDREGVKKGAKWANTSDEALRRRLAQQDGGYGSQEGNIGNLKSDSYLEAMLQVYQQCHKVLKPQGLMILVTKNFIRTKQVVRLDEDTIKLCEQAGFSFLERHYRKLSSQSFWRRIYHQKYPDVEKIEYEDVLVFQR